MRQKHELTHIELAQFSRLRPLAGEAFAFWGRVAKRRELDPTTMITNGINFTALPLDHGKHWCFPVPLKCRKQPPPIVT